MAWFAIGIAAVGVATSVYGAVQSKKAGKEAEVLGGMNAAFIRQETAEEARRLRFEQERTLGRSRSVIAASGFRSGKKSMGASSKAYMTTLKGVQQKELAWLAKSGASRADIAQRGGMVEGQRLKSQATGLFGQAIMTGLQGFGTYQAGKT